MPTGDHQENLLGFDKTTEVLLRNAASIPEAVALISNESREQMHCARLIRCLHPELRPVVAGTFFGPKLAGDLGFRTTRGHPTTDYGDPFIAGDYDLTCK